MTATLPLTTLRFHSPTAELEIAGRVLALSRWSPLPVVQVQRFRLQLSDISGDVDTPGDAPDTITITGDQAQFCGLKQAVQHYVQRRSEAVSQAAASPAISPYLMPQGWLQHVLYLGDLAVSPQASSVLLSSLMLADLSSVLAQLEAQIRVLPEPLRPVSRCRPWRRWGSLAAGLVAVVGTAALIPYLRSEAPTADTTRSETESAEESLASRQIQRSRPQPETAPAPAPQSESEPSPPPATAPLPQTAEAPVSPPAADDASGDRAQTTPGPETALPETAPVPEAASPETGPSAAAPEESAAAANARATDAESRGVTTPEALQPSPADSPPLPQDLAALQAHLTEAWEPPEGLTVPLVYYFTVAPDGTLVAIAAADEQAARYQAAIELPAPESAILNASNQSREIQVILLPNGQVELVMVTPEAAP